MLVLVFCDGNVRVIGEAAGDAGRAAIMGRMPATNNQQQADKEAGSLKPCSRGFSILAAIRKSEGEYGNAMQSEKAPSRRACAT